MGEMRFEAGMRVRLHADGVRILAKPQGGGVWHLDDGLFCMPQHAVAEVLAPAPAPGQRWDRDGEVATIAAATSPEALVLSAAAVDGSLTYSLVAGNAVVMARYLLGWGWSHVADAPGAAGFDAPPPNTVVGADLAQGADRTAVFSLLAPVAGARVRCPSGDVWTIAARGDRLRLERGKLAMPWVSPAEIMVYLRENRFDPLPSWEVARRWIDEAIARARPARPELFASALRHLGERGQDVDPPTRRFIEATVAALVAAEARAPERDAIVHARDAFAAAMGGDGLWWIAGAAVDIYLAGRAAC